MSHVATRTALTDDRTMPRRAKSVYAPPKDSGAVKLSEQRDGRMVRRRWRLHKTRPKLPVRECKSGDDEGQGGCG
jgi:hypothetical protein